MYHLFNKLDAMVAGSPTATERLRMPNGQVIHYPVRQIYPTHPHATADNHFSGNNIMEYAGIKGFGYTVTNRKDRFPVGLKQYFHNEKTQPADYRAKCMRFGNPIVAIQNVEAPTGGNDKNYTRTFVSFQSTGSTNISGVNNLDAVNLYVMKRHRGQGDTKRTWGIECNQARALYLSTYYAVDNVDHMIKNCQMRFISWKYWHQPMCHGHAMVVTAAYDIYRFCCDGLADPEWAVPENERMSFRDFRMTLSKQMLAYDPSMGLLPGDHNFRAYTRLTTAKKQKRKRGKRDRIVYESEGVTAENYQKAKRHKSGRLCGDLQQFLDHSSSVKRSTNQGVCEVCQKKTVWRCKSCSASLCILENRNFTGGSCLVRFHCDSFFGLAKRDARMSDDTKWKPANQNRIRRHAGYMQTLMSKANDEDDSSEEEGSVVGGIVNSTAV
jgi:hypothetical protein